jgi:hypothetical protein
MRDAMKKQGLSPNATALTSHFWTVRHFFENVKVISKAVTDHNVVSIQVAFGIIRIGCGSNI